MEHFLQQRQHHRISVHFKQAVSERETLSSSYVPLILAVLELPHRFQNDMRYLVGDSLWASWIYTTQPVFAANGITADRIPWQHDTQGDLYLSTELQNHCLGLEQGYETVGLQLTAVMTTYRHALLASPLAPAPLRAPASATPAVQQEHAPSAAVAPKRRSSVLPSPSPPEPTSTLALPITAGRGPPTCSACGIAGHKMGQKACTSSYKPRNSAAPPTCGVCNFVGHKAGSFQCPFGTPPTAPTCRACHQQGHRVGHSSCPVSSQPAAPTCTACHQHGHRLGDPVCPTG